MGKGSSFSLGVLLMNIAVALYLFATGIIGVAGRKYAWSSGGEIRKAVDAVFDGDIVNILTIVFAVLAIAAGVFILLKLFGVKISSLGLIMIILAIAWLVFIILIDIVDPLRSRAKPDFLPWLATFGCHLMALGGLVLAGQKN
jgi:hypothetical protein